LWNKEYSIFPFCTFSIFRYLLLFHNWPETGSNQIWNGWLIPEIKVNSKIGIDLVEFDLVLELTKWY